MDDSAALTMLLAQKPEQLALCFWDFSSSFLTAAVKHKVYETPKCVQAVFTCVSSKGLSLRARCG